MADRGMAAPDILSPRENGVFKTLLIKPEANPVLKSIISSVIHKPVMEANVINAEMPISDEREKEPILDVNCVIDNGDQVDIEMYAEAIPGDSFLNSFAQLRGKDVLYLTKLFSTQDARGKSYRNLRRTYALIFMDFIMFREHNDVLTDIFLRTGYGDIFYDALALYCIELPKSRQFLNKNPHDLDQLAMWSLFFEGADKPQF